MNMAEIMATIELLAQSQGYYGRLLRDLIYIRNNHHDIYATLTSLWESQNFQSQLDLIYYLEGGK